MGIKTARGILLLRYILCYLDWMPKPNLHSDHQVVVPIADAQDTADLFEGKAHEME